MIANNISKMEMPFFVKPVYLVAEGKQDDIRHFIELAGSSSSFVCNIILPNGRIDTVLLSSGGTWASMQYKCRSIGITVLHLGDYVNLNPLLTEEDKEYLLPFVTSKTDRDILESLFESVRDIVSFDSDFVVDVSGVDKFFSIAYPNAKITVTVDSVEVVVEGVSTVYETYSIDEAVKQIKNYLEKGLT